MATADRLVGREVLSWALVAIAGGAGLAWMMGAVESVRWGARGMALAALRTPEAIVPLTPLLVGLGAALAASRSHARGERVALEAAGWAPWRTGLSAAGVGLALGMGIWLASDQLVPRAAEAATALEGRAPEGWVWLDDAAVRVGDGLRVRASDGRILSVEHLDPSALNAPEMADALTEAASVQRPRTARGSALARVSLTPAVVERLSRMARVLSVAGLALLGWWPWSRRGGIQVGVALSMGASAAVLDLLLQSFAAQGRLAPWIGAWAGPVLVAGCAAALVLRGFLSR